MARAIILELACTPVHIPRQLPCVFGKSLCTEAALSVYPSPLLVVWNEENKKSTNWVNLEKSWRLPHHSEETRNHSLDVSNKSVFAEMFPLPGLDSVDCCQYILCVVNRRLHYARVVWVVNQYAWFGRLQGNVEHLRKATGLLWTVGSQKTGSWIREILPE